MGNVFRKSSLSPPPTKTDQQEGTNSNPSPLPYVSNQDTDIQDVANQAIQEKKIGTVNLSSRKIVHSPEEKGVMTRIFNWLSNFFGFKKEEKDPDQKILEDWKKEVGSKTWRGLFDPIEEKIIKKEFFDVVPEEVYPTKSMARLERRKNPEFVSVEGLAHGEKELSDRETKIVCENGVEVSIANTLNNDLTRGKYKLNGVKQESVEGFVQQMLSNKLSSDKIKNISYIFNQVLLSPPSQYIAVNFPGVTTKQDAFLVDLQLEEGKPPVIKGTITLKLTTGAEDPNPKYMKVDILVTNAGSDDPNLANVHYCLHPVTSEKPSEKDALL